VRVGHRQALKSKRPVGNPAGRFSLRRVCLLPYCFLTIF
jgi:hypothetical protein